uniref:Uncharacterized protein n=1 Tax=Pithovirus LCPAC304 TaxID=2506594 RepID=A0A481ZA12_9VIRU|nr:MAG: hypothetical protein LCPAC304_05490 [Pithovirus LCPAC304]
MDPIVKESLHSLVAEHYPQFYMFPDGGIVALHKMDVTAIVQTTPETILVRFSDDRCKSYVVSVESGDTETIRNLSDDLSQLYDLVVLPDGQAFDPYLKVNLVQPSTAKTILLVFDRDPLRIVVHKEEDDEEMLPHITNLVLRSYPHTNDE